MTIGQEEMWKMKKNGGIKLINIQLKSETTKAKWIIDMISTPELRIHLEIFTLLIGSQKGQICGKTSRFCKKHIINITVNLNAISTERPWKLYLVLRLEIV